MDAALLEQYGALSVSEMRQILSRLRSHWLAYTSEEAAFPHTECICGPGSMSLLEFCLAFVYTQHRPRPRASASGAKAAV